MGYKLSCLEHEAMATWQRWFSHGRLMKALQHLTQGLARHRLFGHRSGAAPRTFHGAPGSHRTWRNAVKLRETRFFCLKMKRNPADLMSLSDDLLD